MKKAIRSTWIYIVLSITAYLVLSPDAFALDGFYLGGHVGHVALSGDAKTTFNNAIGFGGDIGLSVHPDLDVLYQGQYSTHSGLLDGLKVFSNTLDANIHIGQANDFDFTVQVGPGFYSLSVLGVGDTKFGLNFGAGADVMVDNKIRVGLDWRYHVLMGTNAASYNYWSTMMRIGYWFGSH